MGDLFRPRVAGGGPKAGYRRKAAERRRWSDRRPSAAVRRVNATELNRLVSADGW